MRIASISKPITSLIAAKLYDENKFDLDQSIDFYLPHLPSFKCNDKIVKITSRQLISHTSGIRHYEKKNEINKEKSESGSDTSLKEFYIKDNFRTTKDAMELFINDELLSEPGTEFFYTTHGFTLLSAVLEKISGRSSFSKLLLDLFQVLDMKDTYLDQNDPLIKNRSK